jgi:hypothetical protein
MLRQGVTVADVLYLTPGGAPHVFQPPLSALDGDGVLADKRGYSFDGCSPNILIERAQVRNGRISFPEGTAYRLLVLSGFDTMLPAVLRKIEELVNAGATIVGSPPLKSPSTGNRRASLGFAGHTCNAHGTQIRQGPDLLGWSIFEVRKRIVSRL